MSFVSRLRWFTPLAVGVTLALPVRAEPNAQITALMEALRYEETIAIMQQEGLTYGNEIALAMLPDADMQDWEDTVTRIYDADKIYALIAGKLSTELVGSNVEAMIAQYQTPEMVEIVGLEIAARQAFLDPEIEAMAQDRFAEMDGQGVRLLEQVETLIKDSDLIELNVAGALNADLMFNRGLSEGGAIEMSEDEMLSSVWAQEEELRAYSEEWLPPFLMVAYQPLDPETLDAYAAFWRTPEGRDLNRAIFAAYDQMYNEITYLLGRAVAAELTSQKL